MCLRKLLYLLFYRGFTLNVNGKYRLMANWLCLVDTILKAMKSLLTSMKYGCLMLKSCFGTKLHVLEKFRDQDMVIQLIC